MITLIYLRIFQLESSQINRKKKATKPIKGELETASKSAEIQD